MVPRVGRRAQGDCDPGSRSIAAGCPATGEAQSDGQATGPGKGVGLGWEAMANGPVPRTLTRAQQARRQRVIDAAMTLALEGGYEAVQMRDVAARADVAMGTVYRYFT